MKPCVSHFKEHKMSYLKRQISKNKKIPISFPCRAFHGSWEFERNGYLSKRWRDTERRKDTSKRDGARIQIISIALKYTENANLFIFSISPSSSALDKMTSSVRKDTSSFFLHGSSKQFDYVLKLYPQVLKLKSYQRSAKKPEELIRLDDW